MTHLGLALIISTAAITMAANFLLRAGIDRGVDSAPAGATEIVVKFGKLLLDPLFACGFISYFLASLIWFRVLASEPVSVAYPTLVGLTFFLVTGGATLLLDEPMSARKLFGLLIILLGIVIVSLDSARA